MGARQPLRRARVLVSKLEPGAAIVVRIEQPAHHRRYCRPGVGAAMFVSRNGAVVHLHPPEQLFPHCDTFTSRNARALYAFCRHIEPQVIASRLVAMKVLPHTVQTLCLALARRSLARRL